MNITDDLVKAYLSTEYRVLSPAGTIILRGKGCSDELSALHDSFDVISSAFMTAYNPFSDNTEDAMNEKNQACLVRQVAKQWRYLQGEAVSMSGQWSIEPSVLVLGIDLEDALKIGRNYHQHAILFAQKNTTELYPCRPENAKYFSEH